MKLSSFSTNIHTYLCETIHVQACLAIYLSSWTLSLSLLIVGKSSQQCHSDSSGTADHGAQGTHSLGHKRAPMTGLKPQADKVGTLPRRRDTNTDGKSLHSQTLFIRALLRYSKLTEESLYHVASFCQIPSSTIHSSNSPHTGHEVPAQCGFPHAQLVGSCSLGPLWGVHGDCVNAGAAAYGFLERHINIQQGHPEQGIPQETWHRSLPQRASSHKQHREKGTL